MSGGRKFEDKRATCHPDRLHRGRGLCARCISAERYSASDAHGLIDAVRAVLGLESIAVAEGKRRARMRA